MAGVVRHDTPDRCVVGTVGEPGARTFFLQARSGSLLSSVVLEKEQVAALAERLEQMLDQVVRRSGGQAQVPAATPSSVDDLAPLDLPLEAEFRAGSLSLAWVEEDQQVELILQPGDDGDPDDTGDAEDTGDVGETSETPATGETDEIVVRLSGAQARAFVTRARAVVAAGRPPCPFCSQPLDPSGHVCPRQNGYRRRS